jgi:hypothetical protein
MEAQVKRLHYRYKVILPFVFLSLSVFLALWGEAQMDRFKALATNPRTGNAYEAPNPNLADARYADYALNSPVWAVSKQMPYILPIEWSGRKLGFLRGGVQQDLWYVMFLPIWWFLVGWFIDRKRSGKGLGASGLFTLGIASKLLAADIAFVVFTTIEW